jgi:carbonic anhydrase/acetyltransferase-like protein (isoleucine patch superfamily)
MIVMHSGRTPLVAARAYVQESAQVIGDVEIGEESSVWFYAVVRGDVEPIRIGRRTNLQDHVTVHVTRGRYTTTLGDGVTVAHRVVLHGCTIGDHVLVGIGALVLDGAEVGNEVMIGAGALVAPRTKIPPRTLVLGSPAKVVRELRPEEIEHLHRSADYYVEYAAAYRAQGL